MKFYIQELPKKLKVKVYLKYNYETYSNIYKEFDKKYPDRKCCKKINFRQGEINGKYGKSYLYEFDILLTHVF